MIKQYFTAIPNIGAGIGHRLANWIAGYWFAKVLNLNFAHTPFPSEKWENLLGLGEGEVSVDELVEAGYTKIKLPLFRETDSIGVEWIRRFIEANKNAKVIFEAAQDQYYFDQFGVMDELSQKYFQAKSRENDRLKYVESNFNIAVHVRRAVVIDGRESFEDAAAKEARWLDNDYYECVLKNILLKLKVNKPVAIFIFSTSDASEFLEFNKYGNVYFCSEMDEYDTFVHLAKADLLITSKSSFSYKAGLISKGIKVAPKNFWHGYPKIDGWILADNAGNIDYKESEISP